MSIITNVIDQIIVMFLLIGVGFVANKKGIITNKGTKELNDFLIRVVLGAVIINSFFIEFEEKLLTNLAITFILAIMIHVIATIIAIIFIKKEDGAMRFATVYSNCGFMCFPIAAALYGQLGTFYALAYVVIYNVFVWAHGVTFLQNDEQLTFSGKIKKIATNPVIICTLVGILLFILQIPIPNQVQNVVGYVASLNTPLAMILLGVFTSQTDIISGLKNKKIYFVSAIRLIIVPITVIFALKAVLLLVNIDSEILMVMIISSACPVGAMLPMLCEKFSLEKEQSVQIVAYTTLLTALTIPFIIWLSNIIL